MNRKQSLSRFPFSNEEAVEFPSLSNFATDRKLEKSNWRESVPYSKLSLDNNQCETSIVLYVAQVMLVAVNEPPP